MTIRNSVPWHLYFEGQSYNVVPPDDPFVPELGHSYPYYLMRDLDMDLFAGRGIAYSVPAIGGLSMTTLYTTILARIIAHIGEDTNSGVIICGAQSDIWGGDTGAQVYADMVTHANRIMDAGANFVACTTLVGNAVNDANMELERADFNTLLKADASNAFDVIIDLEETPLVDWTDTDYYLGDFVHWHGEGAKVCAQKVYTEINSLVV